MHEIVKIASHQLNRTSDDQIVKVAGILRRLKNWLKTHFSPEFKEEIEKLEVESAEHSIALQKIKAQIEKVQEAIQDKELDEYREELKNLKDLLDKTSLKTEKTLGQVSNVQNISGRKRTFVELNPEIIDEYNNLMETYGYDFPLNTILNKKFSESEYYNKINYKSLPIIMNPTPQDILKEKLFTTLKNTLGISTSEIEDKIGSEFYSNLTEAILNGTVETVTYQVSSGKKSATLGQLLLTVISDVFKIPSTNIKIKAEVDLVDSTLTNDLKFSLRATHKIISFTSGHELISSSDDRKSYYLNMVKTAKREEKSEIKAKEVSIYSETHSPLEAAKILESSYKSLFNKLPPLPLLAFAWAQITWEHGRNYKFPCNNIGNIKVDSNWLADSSKLYFRTKTIEYEGEKSFSTGALWKAFETPEDGAKEYWKLISTRYSDAFNHMKEGKPIEASESLKKKDYYTAPFEEYTAGVKSIYNEFIKKYSKEFSYLPGAEIFISDRPGTAPPQQPANSSGSSETSHTQYDQLQKTLYASPLTNLVKTALFKINNPEKKILIQVEGSDLIDNLEYANNLNYLIHDYLNGSTSIHKINEKIQIQAIANTQHNLKHAVTELSGLLSNEISKKLNKNVYTIIAEELPSFAEEVSEEDIESNHRKFTMRYS